MKPALKCPHDNDGEANDQQWKHSRKSVSHSAHSERTSSLYRVVMRIE